MLQDVFADGIDYGRVRIHPHRLLSPTRAMTPWGRMYLPGGWYAPDLSSQAVPLNVRAVFVHEGAHLYQWYGLRRLVWLRGMVSRNYDYELVPGKPYPAYGLEQMGQIAEDYYTLLNGGRTGRPYKLADYQPLLPVR